MDDEPLNVNPLGFCDDATVDEKQDLEYCDSVDKKMVGETVRSYHNPAHSWFYLGKQTKDEVWLFRSSISDTIPRRPCESRLPDRPHS